MDKRKVTIEYDRLIFDDNSEANLENWREKGIPIPKIKGFSVDFTGWNEGSASPCKDWAEVQEKIKYLLERHKEYDIKVINKMEVQECL